MKDALGRDLKVGDFVAFRPSYLNSIRGGTVTKLTPKGATIGVKKDVTKYDSFSNKVFATGETKIKINPRDSSWIVLLDKVEEGFDDYSFFNV